VLDVRSRGTAQCSAVRCIAYFANSQHFSDEASGRSGKTRKTQFAAQSTTLHRGAHIAAQCCHVTATWTTLRGDAQRVQSSARLARSDVRHVDAMTREIMRRLRSAAPSNAVNWPQSGAAHQSTSQQRTGQQCQVYCTVLCHNPWLRPSEVLHIARHSSAMGCAPHCTSLL
jgi:hypothetical protein